MLTLYHVAVTTCTKIIGGTYMTLKKSKILALIILIPFTLLTFLAVKDYGFIGIFKEIFKNFATIQVFIDLIIATIFILVWIWKDSKKNNRNFLIWLIITLIFGSFGPFLYIISSKEK